MIKNLLVPSGGYLFHFWDGHVKFWCAALALLADTSTSYLARAFKGSIGGARKMCRHSMTSFEDMNEHLMEGEFSSRNQTIMKNS